MSSSQIQREVAVWGCSLRNVAMGMGPGRFATCNLHRARPCP